MGAEIVIIPLGRYEELLDCETRFDVITDYLEHTEYIKHKDLYLLLGNTQKVEELERLEAMALETYRAKKETEE